MINPTYDRRRIVTQPLDTPPTEFQRFLERTEEEPNSSTGRRRASRPVTSAGNSPQETDSTPTSTESYGLKRPELPPSYSSVDTARTQTGTPPPPYTGRSRTVERYIREDGKVAMLVSNSHLHPWSLDCNFSKGQEVITYDKDLVKAILEEKWTQAATIAKDKLSLVDPGHVLLAGEWDLEDVIRTVAFHWVEPDD